MRRRFLDGPIAASGTRFHATLFPFIGYRDSLLFVPAICLGRAEDPQHVFLSSREIRKPESGPIDRTNLKGVHRPGSDQTAPLGSILFVGAVSAWGNLTRWTADIERRSVLLREARAAREYLESDLLEHELVPQSDPDRLILMVAAERDLEKFGVNSTIEYRRSDDYLLRSVRSGEVLVAKYLSKVEFHFDPLTRELASSLVFGDEVRLDLTTQTVAGTDKDRDKDKDKDKARISLAFLMWALTPPAERG
ncbi:MAG: hypothetical protein ACE5GX_15520 [Thermoanaerobaculia bacterium]